MWWVWRTELWWAALPRLHYLATLARFHRRGKGWQAEDSVGGEDAELATQRCEHAIEFYLIFRKEK
jgi:hypothetical protein